MGPPVDETSSLQKVWSWLAGKWGHSLCSSLFISPGIWVIHPILEVPAMVAGDGEGTDMTVLQGILKAGERATQATSRHLQRCQGNVRVKRAG